MMKLMGFDPIKIESYRPALLPQLQGLVNAHLGTLVPGWALPESFIHDRLARHPEQIVLDPWVVARDTLCAVQAGRVVAAAHLRRYGVGPEIAAAYRNAVDLAWFLAVPSAVEAADQLIKEVLHRSVKLNASRVTAFDAGLPVPACVGVPDSWPHISEALARHGFRPDERRAEALYGGWLKSSSHASVPVDGLEVERRLGQFNICFWLRRGDEWLGHCECVADLTQGGALPSLRGWAVLFELEVAPSWRNRGLGTYLVQQVVAWLRLAGCDRVVVPVAAEDEAQGAGRFYRRFGWEVLAHEADAWRT